MLAEQICQREKYWNERDRDEKFEALRQQVIQLTHMITSMIDNVQALMQHQHSQTGALMTPMDGRNSAYAGGSRYMPHSLEIDPQVQAANYAEQRGVGAIHGR